VSAKTKKYGVGLRISEALCLKPQDVDLSDSLLTIHESKFYRTRLVPIGPRLTSSLASSLMAFLRSL
jgi:site-specific recombinase XerD